MTFSTWTMEEIMEAMKFGAFNVFDNLFTRS